MNLNSNLVYIYASPPPAGIYLQTALRVVSKREASHFHQEWLFILYSNDGHCTLFYKSGYAGMVSFRLFAKLKLSMSLKFTVYQREATQEL